MEKEKESQDWQLTLKEPPPPYVDEGSQSSEVPLSPTTKRSLSFLSMLMIRALKMVYNAENFTKARVSD
jgi:hypothetical protein